jgi:hypothetical protein
MAIPIFNNQQFVVNPIPVLRKLGAASERKLAAIAYVTRDWLQFSSEDLLICDASDAAIETGRTCRKLLKELSDANVKLYSNSLLHAKVAVFDFQTACVGSANLSEFAAKRIECGIVTSHPPSVEEVVRFIYRLQNESVKIDDAFLNRIAKLKILKRVPQLPSKAKKTLIALQNDESGVTYWFFKGTQSLSKNAQEVGDKMKAKWADHVEESTSDDYEDISEEINPLHFESLQQSDERWINDLQLGDRVLWCYEDDDWGWIVMPPRTVVSKATYGKSLVAGTVGRYWDFSRSLYRKQVLELLELPENSSLRKIESDCAQLRKLIVDWDVLLELGE